MTKNIHKALLFLCGIAVIGPVSAMRRAERADVARVEEDARTFGRAPQEGIIFSSLEEAQGFLTQMITYTPRKDLTEFLKMYADQRGGTPISATDMAEHEAFLEKALVLPGLPSGTSVKSLKTTLEQFIGSVPYESLKKAVARSADSTIPESVFKERFAQTAAKGLARIYQAYETEEREEAPVTLADASGFLEETINRASAKDLQEFLEMSLAQIQGKTPSAEVMREHTEFLQQTAAELDEEPEEIERGLNFVMSAVSERALVKALAKSREPHVSEDDFKAFFKKVAVRSFRKAMEKTLAEEPAEAVLAAPLPLEAERTRPVESRSLPPQGESLDFEPRVTVLTELSPAVRELFVRTSRDGLQVLLPRVDGRGHQKTAAGGLLNLHLHYPGKKGEEISQDKSTLMEYVQSLIATSEFQDYLLQTSQLESTQEMHLITHALNRTVERAHSLALREAEIVRDAASSVERQERIQQEAQSLLTDFLGYGGDMRSLVALTRGWLKTDEPEFLRSAFLPLIKAHVRSHGGSWTRFNTALTDPNTIQADAVFTQLRGDPYTPRMVPTLSLPEARKRLAGELRTHFSHPKNTLEVLKLLGERLLPDLRAEGHSVTEFVKVLSPGYVEARKEQKRAAKAERRSRR